MSKKINKAQLQYLKELANNARQFIERDDWKIDGPSTSYDKMIRYMCSEVNSQGNNIQLDPSKKGTYDEFRPTSDSRDQGEKNDEISRFALAKIGIYQAAKEKLDARPWYRFLFHPIDSYRESKQLKALKEELTSDLYGITETSLSNIEEFFDVSKTIENREDRKKLLPNTDKGYEIDENGKLVFDLDDDDEISIMNDNTISNESPELDWGDDDEIEIEKPVADRNRELREKLNKQFEEFNNPTTNKSKKIDTKEMNKETVEVFDLDD